MSQRPETATSHQLVEQLFAAKTSDDCRAVLAAAAQQGIEGERLLGDRENNAGTVQFASNPYSALVERVTNAIDGLLDMKAEEAPSENMPQSPREAATAWYGVPKAGLNDLTKSERRALAENVRVTLEQSGRKHDPTVVIEDRGIGQHPLEFPKGLLSLNRSNKLHKRWLQGAYGQGGSATFRFSDYTLLIGRRKPSLLDGQDDLVGWTVVWEDDGDPYEEALPVYKYLVGPDNEIPVFDVGSLPDPDWHGVRIVHISYELRKYAQAYTQLETGIWGMFHSALFDPVLPFIVSGRREIDTRASRSPGPTRTVIGNAARLNNPDGPSGDLEVSYANSETFDLGKALGGDFGRFRVNYWVLQRDPQSKSKKDPSASYVTAENAVSMTLYGQRQDSERRGWLKGQVELPYLTRNILVQIDVDALSPPAKRKLFSSTRERGVEGELRDTIYRETAALLREDGELRRLEHEERERLRARGAEEVGDKVREKLRKFVQSFLQDKRRKVPGVSEVPKRRRNGGGHTKTKRDTDDAGLPNVPSRIAFERDPITISQGRRTTVWFSADAKNGYLRRHEDDLSVSFEDSLAGKIADVAKSELLAGRSLWTLQAADDAPLGEGNIEAVLMTPNGLLTANARIQVIKPPKERKRHRKEAPDQGPEIRWVKRDEWDELEFDERTVGRVNIGADATDILVNRDQRILEKALGSRKLSPTEVRVREERYLFAVACGLYRQEHQTRELKQQPDEQYVIQEQERLAEAVLIAIDEKLIELEDD